MNDKKLKTGLFFGSFNPIHVGHLIIADFFVQFTDLDKVLFVVSPQNPFKLNESLLDENSRLELVKLATGDDPGFDVSDVEFNMEQPSYTYKTLKNLLSKHPEKEFVLIIGSDNLDEFDKWKNYEEILEMIRIYVYPRPGFSGSPFLQHPNVFLKDAPVMEISSSFIRQSLEKGKDPKYMLPEKVYDEIVKKGYYGRNKRK